MRGLTELEGAVLGLVALDQPCTPYRVRQFFTRSASPHWSGSGGAIYPLLRRLERRSLVSSSASRLGRRQSRVYRPTVGGSRELSRWILRVVSAETIGVPLDPLRTRMRFLGTVPMATRRRVLERARERLGHHTATVERDCVKKRKGRDVFSYVTARGALLMCRARLRWLGEIQGMVNGLGPTRESRRP